MRLESNHVLFGIETLERSGGHNDKFRERCRGHCDLSIASFGHDEHHPCLELNFRTFLLENTPHVRTLPIAESAGRNGEYFTRLINIALNTDRKINARHTLPARNSIPERFRLAPEALAHRSAASRAESHTSKENE